jgi:hypothetical protein
LWDADFGRGGSSWDQAKSDEPITIPNLDGLATDKAPSLRHGILIRQNTGNLSLRCFLP